MKYCRWIALILIVFVADPAAGQTLTGFGRNKIQYSGFDWHILQTEHFDVYYYPEMRELAERGANWAEESYDHLSNKLNYEIDRRIPLIFYSSHLHFQQTNVSPYFLPEGVAGFFEFLKGRVVIPSDGSWHRFKRVIRHELAHVFTYSKMQRSYRDHRSVNRSGMPLWFTEGIAEYLSGEWDDQSDMVIRDAVINNYLVPLTEIHRINGTYLMYKEGEDLLRYIDRTYGSEKVLLVLENLWRAVKFEQVFVGTIGKTYKQLSKEWVYDLKKRYYPKLEFEDIPSIASQQVTGAHFNAKPAFYRDGDEPMVAFISNRIGYTGIYKQSLNDKLGETAEPILLGEKTAQFEAFHPFRSRNDVNQQQELAFVTKSGERDALHIWDLRLKSSTQMIQFDELVAISSPSWSPDGQRLVFTALDFTGNSDLFIYDRMSEKLSRLTNDYYDDRDPAWSPNSRYVAFTSDRGIYGADTKYNLFVIDLHENTMSYLNPIATTEMAPAWSPDGQSLAYTSVTDGATNVWVMQVDEQTTESSVTRFEPPEDGLIDPAPLLRGNLLATERRQMTSLSTAAFDPEWTDDNRLLFGTFESFEFHIMQLENVMETFAEKESLPVNTGGVAHAAWDVPRISNTRDIKAEDYVRSYALDFAMGQVSFDPVYQSTGGAQMIVSDVLGDDYYNLFIYNNAQQQDDFLNSFNFALTRVATGGRVNWMYGLYHFDFRAYQNRSSFLEENQYGGFITAIYPFSMFRRFEINATFASDDKEKSFPQLRRRKALLYSNFVTFVHDNTIWGPTGPMDGRRYSVTGGFTQDVWHNKVHYLTFVGDMRNYLRITNRVSYAVRAMMLYTGGKDTPRYFMGGTWDLRGFDRFSLWGNRLGLLSQELRFPLMDVLFLGFPKFGMAFPGWRGALFADVGNAWTDNFSGILGSFGGGIRFPIGFFTLRLDAGKRVGKSEKRNLYSLQNGLFWQFFFGHDF
jgi:hypothetical protein